MRSNAAHHAIRPGEEEEHVQRRQHDRPYGGEQEKSSLIAFVSTEVIVVLVEASDEKRRYRKLYDAEKNKGSEYNCVSFANPIFKSHFIDIWEVSMVSLVVSSCK